jgi:hypothetical protein
LVIVQKTGLVPAVLEVLEKGKSLNLAGIPQSFCPMPSHNIMTVLVYLLSGLSYFASGMPFIVISDTLYVFRIHILTIHNVQKEPLRPL